jgi:hypothetical protein
MQTTVRSTAFLRRAAGAVVGATLLLAPWSMASGEKTGAKEVAARPPMAPASARLTAEAWKAPPLLPLQSHKIDQLIGRELEQARIAPAPLTTDEQFIRRVTLDVTGELPVPADVDEFVADKDTRKRARLIDKLLASDEYARHWARYWRDVIASRVTDIRGLALSRPFELWLEEQIKANKSWGEIARAMITAEGPCRFDDDGKSGAAFFLLSRVGADAATERAAETSRLFLGIQIQCAQCHDHPFDQWKRVQFHELVGYFSRVRERPLLENGQQPLLGLQLVSLPRGEHEMPGKEDPRRGTRTDPRFLDGKSPGIGLSDRARRQALASAIVDKDNYWFAGAYVNRVWGELMGQSFYTPVDDMGPQKEAVFGSVLARLAASFRATDYDMKALFRAILNSQTYQRQIRPGESSGDHLQFAAAYPSRLHGDALWESLVGVLGKLERAQPGRRSGLQIYAAPRGLEAEFKREFDFDPSTKPDEVEGSISQALMLMNNPAINQRIEARGTNLLGRILTAYPRDHDALRILYLRALARKPTDRERDRCLSFIRTTGNRREAFEDILWALINSTEFQTKR